jgi:hypothetical protein
VPCYRCGARQSDPDPGKPSPWRQGLIAEHQVLLCPDCYPPAADNLTRCSRCAGVRLIRRLDQVECLDCHRTRDAETEPAIPAPRPVDSGLAAEVARALERIRSSQ